VFGGTDDTIVNLPANINVLRVEQALPAELTSRKRTRIRVLSLNFRANIRDSNNVIGIITPVHKNDLSLAASVIGLSHEKDLPASISPIRLIPEDARFTPSELLVNLQNAFITKEVFISFRSQVSSYVFEDVSSAVYPTERGTWAIDLRSLSPQESFFDLDPTNRNLALDKIDEYYSLDEAIRAALVILCERRKANLSASLNAVGGSFNLGALVEVTSIDRFLDMRAAIVSVLNAPDLSADINLGPGSSDLLELLGILSPRVGSTVSLNASVVGHILEDLSAEIIVS